MKFFNQTSYYKELLLLQYIEKHPKTSQHEIAREIRSAASMVNVYINRLEEEGYLIRDYRSTKIVYYNITPKGIMRKKYLYVTYLHELLELYIMAEENIERFFQRLENKGYKRILVYGAGEAALTIIGIIEGRKNISLKVLGIIDDNKEKQGKKLLKHKIISREEINKYKHDGIVVISYSNEDEIINKLIEMNYPKTKIERFFSEFEEVSYEVNKFNCETKFGED